MVQAIRSLKMNLYIFLLILILLITAVAGIIMKTTDESNVEVSSYKRPYGDNAPWNLPVVDEGGNRLIPLHLYSDLYRDRLWFYGSDRTGNYNINLGYDGYTYPVYESNDAVGWYPVEVKWKSNLEGNTMPWNPKWSAASGTDGQVIVIDQKTGMEWNLWQVSFDGSVIHATNGNLIQEGTERGDGKEPASYFTKENGFVPSRGCGIQYMAMLVRPEEVREGVIRHALSMPVCNPDQNIYISPATKLEAIKSEVKSSEAIPEGMRFALDITDVEIEAWVSSLPPELPSQAYTTARIIARALRDYGWFITDTSGGAHLQFEDVHTARDEWEELGMGIIEMPNGKKYPRDLLDGLMERHRIYTLIPSDEYP